MACYDKANGWTKINQPQTWVIIINLIPIRFVDGSSVWVALKNVESSTVMLQIGTPKNYMVVVGVMVVTVAASRMETLTCFGVL